MRIKLKLRPKEKICSVPINYQYPISAVIYKILSVNSSEYGSWLHNKGYISHCGRPMKLFTFSFLDIPKQSKKIEQDVIIIKDRALCELLISSPMLEDFISNFVEGTFLNRQIEIANFKVKGGFDVESIDIVPSCEFENKPEISEKFKCLSPFLVSTKRESGPSEYLRPDDERLNGAIERNLQQKLAIIHKIDATNHNIQFNWDEDYIRRKKGYHKISKLITIHERDAKQIQLKCFLAPFFLTGSPLLIQCAYECGIGEKNSLGLGMIEKVKKI